MGILVVARRGTIHYEVSVVFSRAWDKSDIGREGAGVKPTLFIGSSTEQMEVARALELNLSDDAEVTIWPLTFHPGGTIYDQLIQQSRSSDFAVIIVNPDDKIISKGNEATAPRDNVIFELGLFLGSIGPERVFAICSEDAKQKAKLPSGYLGVDLLTYDGERSDHELIKALSPPSTRILGAIKKLGKIDKANDIKNYLFAGELIGLEKVYENFDSARDHIYEDLKNTQGPIKIFIHIASQDIGLKGAFFDVLKEVVEKKTVDIRVLHAAHESPLFSKDRLLLIGKNYDHVIASLEYASSSLRRLETIEASALRRRSHELPFIWRLYFVFDRLYMMPYFSTKDAVKKSPVLVFSRQENSLYHVFRDWFDHTWALSIPVRVELTDVVSPAAPAGSALLLKWEGKHVFGIPMRDLRSDPSRVRFYGIGGKRQSSTETFEECALREGNEELSGAIERLENASETTYFRNDGTARSISVSGSKILPRLILEKAEHSGVGIMAVNADDYFLVVFEGKLQSAPKPSREVAAVVLFPDVCLKRFLQTPTVTLDDARALGAEIIMQKEITIPGEAVLVPHGSANFVIRSLV